MVKANSGFAIGVSSSILCVPLIGTPPIGDNLIFHNDDFMVP
jgi:hypothetical protein